jgi:hypothetical protein
LTVVVQFNRRTTFSPKKIVVPANLRIAALWFLVCTKSDQSEWAIWGNFLEEPEGTRFAYPV